VKPKPNELQEMRAGAAEDASFRNVMRASAHRARDWARAHPTKASSLFVAIQRLATLFRTLTPGREPTRGERYPLL